MLYSIINRQKAAERGLKEAYCVVSNDRQLVIVNENDIRELSDKGDNIATTAAKMDGKILSFNELKYELNKNAELWQQK